MVELFCEIDEWDPMIKSANGFRVRRVKIYISRFNLVNFRNYESLSLEFGPGLILIEGENGQGKSNLLEAAYLLAIAKSNRASSERELVRNAARTEPQSHAQVSAELRLSDGNVSLQADFTTPSVAAEPPQSATGPFPEATVYHKTFRVNGVGRRSTDVVGILNAVMFGADDLELVYGTPSVRRRYLDILISQLDDRYLRSLQRYNKVLAQRNHLLKRVRQRYGSPDELQFWDGELAAEGAYIIERRAETVAWLNESAALLHADMSGQDEELNLVYRPSIALPITEAAGAGTESFIQALATVRERELAQGFTVLGPHRDDLEPQLAGFEASAYASRGQVRTVVLAMKLAEGEHLRERRAEEPVLLLDDVLSELDSNRRELVLEKASLYQQCFVTTADREAIGGHRLSGVQHYRVSSGTVEPTTIIA